MLQIDPDVPVLVAGDPERIHMEKVNKEGGLVYSEDQLQTCESLSRRLNVQPLRFVCLIHFFFLNKNSKLSKQTTTMRGK